VLNGNNIRILGLMLLDAGIFQCVASNPAGEIQAAARLVVLKPGTIFYLYNLAILVLSYF
jgi:neogenin